MTSRFVCFTGQSALRILRAVSERELVSVKRKCCLPSGVPTKRELEAAVNELRAAYPHLHFDGVVDTRAFSASRRQMPKGYRVRYSSWAFSAGSFYRWGDRILVAASPLALVDVAADEGRRMPLIERVWEACGSYATVWTDDRTRYQVRPLTSASAVRSYAARNSGLYGANRLCSILKYVADGSASPRETKLALLLGLPMRFGGYGLGIPTMNYAVEANRAARVLSGRSSFRCDLCWPEAMLDVEYQSRESHEGEGNRIRDSRRANALALMGWTVMGVTNDELDSYAAMESVQQAVARRLGKRRFLRVEGYHEKKLELRRLLGLPHGYE